MNIYEKLATIQQELKAPKNQYSDYGGYHYRSCEDILEGLKPCLEKVNALVVLSDELVLVGDRYYIKATATLIDIESTERISNTAFARETESRPKMDASQITGSSSTYARKYALNGLFCIDDVKDADSMDNRQIEEKKPETKQKKAESGQKKAEAEPKKIENSVISEVKVKALLARCDKEGVEPAKILKLYKVNSIADLTEIMYANINEFWDRLKEA